MAKEKDTQASLVELLLEAKEHYELQKTYLRYTAAEELTLVISKLAIVIVLALVGFVAFVFLGLAFVNWFGATFGNLALGYVIYALLLIIVLCIFYINRRRWVTLPLARLMMQTFVEKKEEVEEEAEDEE